MNIGLAFPDKTRVAGLTAEIVRLTTIIARARVALAKESLTPEERIADADKLLSADHG